ncbi:hypothetical protein HYY71_04240 [Candidatus Woesearchaeota archaeon]|nr:hypothetical protein [Candidatus Woesearchaeota archaeon]
MDKKAFEIQFNWIFVLVAGAAILLFFTAVVLKQKSLSELSTKAVVIKTIDAIITGAGVSTDTINIVDIPNSNIEVGCNRAAKQYQNLILFAPGLIKGDKLITQTMAFSAPYRATNLLFMTSPQVRYIIIGSNSLAREINKSLPSDLKKEFYESMPEIRNSNNYKVRLIIFENMIDVPRALEKMPDHDVTAVKVNGNNEKGTIEFWEKSGNSWLSKGSSAYIGKQPLIGAVYADTLEAYECSMRNAFSRLNFVTKIYAGRTRELLRRASISGNQPQCSQSYSSALAHLSSISAASSNFGIDSINTIAAASKLLADQNKNAQIHSCTLIY